MADVKARKATIFGVTANEAEAGDVFEVNGVSYMSPDAVSKAIMAATLAEREACAQLADQRGLWHVGASDMSLPVEPSPIIAKDRAKVAFSIRDEIRKRGEL